MSRAKDALKGAVDILGPLFVGTKGQARRKAREVAEDVEAQIQARRAARPLNQPLELPPRTEEDDT